LRNKGERGNLSVLMQSGNNGGQSAPVEAFRAGVPAVVERVLAGGQGFTVRCTPHRRTVMVHTDDGDTLFVKLRQGRHADARAEWHWLHVLPMLGLQVPQPVTLERRGRQSVLCTMQAPGRPLDALLAEALRAGERARVLRFCCTAVAPRVQRLHDQGLVFRDLYWNHLFAQSLDAAADITFVDVERVFRPRWRAWRWGVKDLAGLAASFPEVVPPRAGMRFLVAYLGERAGDRRLRRRLFEAVRRKAARIRAHQPRYG
jgi:hypothetical protein